MHNINAYCKAILLLLLLVVVACFSIVWRQPAPAVPKVYSGLVTSVIDGDTLSIRDTDYNHHRVRLASIDAPELDQPYGKEASIILRNLLFNKNVVVSVTSIDKYNREVAHVHYGAKNDTSSTMLRCGAAWHFSYFDRDSANYEKHQQLQALARKEKQGLWEMPNPTPPWQWRRK